VNQPGVRPVVARVVMAPSFLFGVGCRRA
jgi:hypothetical protein